MAPEQLLRPLLSSASALPPAAVRLLARWMPESDPPRPWAGDPGARGLSSPVAGRLLGLFEAVVPPVGDTTCPELLIRPAVRVRDVGRMPPALDCEVHGRCACTDSDC